MLKVDDMTDEEFLAAVEATNSPTAKHTDRLEAEIARMRDRIERLRGASGST